MTAPGNDAFGSDFIPGKVKVDNTAATQAYGRRWSGMPAYNSLEDGEAQHLEGFGASQSPSKIQSKS